MASESIAAEIKTYVKERIAPYKCPRWIEFVNELPKTATGKIQRYRLRQREAESTESAGSIMQSREET